MLTHADVCSRMLTYAHVCSHMLTSHRWVLGQTDDAVLSDSSSFGYAAAARAPHWGSLVPVTVWNSDAVDNTCARRCSVYLLYCARRYSVYLLCWYKSTNTDAPCFTECGRIASATARRPLLTLLRSASPPILLSPLYRRGFVSRC